LLFEFASQNAISNKTCDHAACRVPELTVEFKLFDESERVLLVNGKLYDVDERHESDRHIKDPPKANYEREEAASDCVGRIVAVTNSGHGHADEPKGVDIEREVRASATSG